MTNWSSVIVERRSSLGSLLSDNRTRDSAYSVFKLCVPPGDIRREPDEGTATAQAHPPDGGYPLEVPGCFQRTRNPVKGRRGSPRPRATPGFFPDLPPFQVAINAYGSATVRPYVGAVKRVALPIVALAINRSGAPYFHRGRIDCSARSWSQ